MYYRYDIKNKLRFRDTSQDGIWATSTYKDSIILNLFEDEISNGYTKMALNYAIDALPNRPAISRIFN